MDIVPSLQTLLTGASGPHWLIAVILVYLGGVMTSFTPCIFPMIPITFTVLSSVNTRPRKYGSLLAVLTYGMGLSLAYAAIGIVAVLSGGIFGSFFQTIWVKIFIANLFMLIGFNTMGWVRLPQVHFQRRQLHSMFSVFTLGFVSGFTLSPCTLPLLSVVLSFAAGKSVLMGAFLLWVYAWGFFTILLLLGLFGNRFRNRLPKSGNWLRGVELVLFLLCLAVAEYFLIQAGSLW